MIKKSSYLITHNNNGLFCKHGNFWIDPNIPVKKSIVTHAHFDHLSFGCDEYICSSETEFILKKRLGNNLNITSYDYGEIFKINGLNISLHPSGHILGSSQVKINSEGEIWLITGDFKRQKDPTCHSYEEIKADYLICESTFALPIFNWDPTLKIISEISNWVLNSEDKTSILFCYSLGKAQRILSEIDNKVFKNIYTQKNISEMNEVYREVGINIPRTKSLDKDTNIDELENSLIIAPPSFNNKNFLKRFRKYQTGFASGWMAIRAFKKRSGYDKGFCISDHADWNGLVSTIKSSGAKEILLNHGDGENLAKYLSDTERISIKSLK